MNKNTDWRVKCVGNIKLYILMWADFAKFVQFHKFANIFTFGLTMNVTNVII